MTTEIVKAGGALAIRPDQTEWTPEQAAVLQQSGISNEVTSAELAGFLHLCQRTKLDPFSRQLYLIGRYDKREKRKVFNPQTGIDGYRIIAHRVAAETRQPFGYEDTLWCDQSGRWRDVWLADEPPAAAKVTVLRGGQRFSAVARFSEYAQTFPDGNPSGLWGKMPAGQIAKCAEALALRKAYPHDLAGVYTAEEMAQVDNPAPVAEQQSGTVRQLRRVQPGEADPWQTPAPAEQPQGVAPQRAATPQRDYLHEAHRAPDAATVRQIWLDAKEDMAVPEYLAQIAEVGRQKAAAEQPTPAAEPEVVDAEVVDDRADAEAQLRATAGEVGLADDIEAEFFASYGVAFADATAEQFQQMARILRGEAA